MLQIVDIKELSQWKEVCGVYRFTNIISSKFYIGSSEDLEYRFYCHIWGLQNNEHHNKHFQASFNKHDKTFDNWKIEVLSICEEEFQIQEEQFYLDTLLYAKEYRDTNGKDNRFLESGYNLSPTAGKTTGYKHSEEVLSIMSKNQRDRWADPVFRLKMETLYSTEEYKENKSKIFTEIWSDKDRRREQSERKFLLNQNLEYKEFWNSIVSSEEYKQKHRDNSTELWKNQEYRDKIHNEENHKKLSNSITELWQDEEYRKKVTESQNNPEVNRKRQEKRQETMTKDDYVNPCNKVIELVDRQTGEVALSFLSVKLVQEYIKDTFNKSATNIRYYTNRPHKDYFGYMWRYKQ